jgi:hypothetical protein
VQHLTSLTTAEDLDVTYQLMNPAAFTAQQAGVMAGNLQFGSALLSCKRADGDYHFVSERQCGWFSISSMGQQQDAAGERSGIHRNGTTLAGGMQFALNDTWHLGFAASRGWDDLSADRLDIERVQSAKGRINQAGVVAKGNFGDTTLALGLSGGEANYHSTRTTLFNAQAYSDQRVRFAAAQLRIAHAFDHSKWYWRPMFDTTLQRVHRSAFSEVGGGANALDVLANTDTFVTLQPALEFGVQVTPSTRWYARTGVSRIVGDPELRTSATLQGAPTGVAPFSVTEQLDRTRAEVAAGIDMFTARGVVLRLGYTGRISSHSEQHEGSFKVSVPF